MTSEPPWAQIHLRERGLANYCSGIPGGGSGETGVIDMRGLRVWGAVGASVLATAGLLSAAAVSSASSATPTERFIGLNNNPSVNGVQVVVANGPIHARGKDVVVSAHVDRFVFPKGSVKVRHHATSNRQHHDRVTCFGTFTQDGTYRIVGGTGAYAGATGHGDYTVHAQFVGCSRTRPPHPFQLVLRAKGPLNL